MRTLAWFEVRGTLLIVHSQAAPAPEEWAALMKTGELLGSRMKRCLVIADVQLSPRQRSEIAASTKAAGTEAVAVVTSSAIGRMIVTGLGWISGIHKGFDPNNFDAALDYLELSTLDRVEILHAAYELTIEFGLSSLSFRFSNHPLLRDGAA